MTCTTCKKPNAKEQYDNGVYCGIHCDTCFEQILIKRQEET